MKDSSIGWYCLLILEPLIKRMLVSAASFIVRFFGSLGLYNGVVSMLMLRSKNKIIGVIIFLLNFSAGIAEAKPLEFQISIPVVFLSDKLFDYMIKKGNVIITPDRNPLVESINQDARNKYHLYHPTWREFVLFQ